MGLSDPWNVRLLHATTAQVLEVRSLSVPAAAGGAVTQGERFKYVDGLTCAWKPVQHSALVASNSFATMLPLFLSPFRQAEDLRWHILHAGDVDNES